MIFKRKPQVKGRVGLVVSQNRVSISRVVAEHGAKTLVEFEACG